MMSKVATSIVGVDQLISSPVWNLALAGLATTLSARFADAFVCKVKYKNNINVKYLIMIS